MDAKDQIHNLQQLCAKLLKELQSRIQARAESNLPEWEDHAARLGVNVPRDPRRSRLLPEADTILCSHCANGQVLELRVQLDQKVYQPCFCAGNTIDKLARAVFAEGYKRATEDSQQKS